MIKRALYYCRVNRDERSNTGLVRKCLGQVEGLRASGFDVDMLWLCDDGVLLNEKLVIKTPWKIKSHTWWCYAFYYLFMHWMIMGKVKLRGYELFFGRYELSHPMLLRFLKRFRKLNPNARMVMEIPSYPYEREMSGFLRQIQYGIDRIWRKRLKNVLDYLVTPGLYFRLFGLQVITMPNGISVDNIPAAKWCQQEGVLRLVGTGNWRWWHGVDRILYGLEKYYRKEKPPLTITVHLVGSTDQLPWIHPAIREKGLSQYVKLSPPRQGELLCEVFNETDLAIGNLGGFRTNLPLGFPLKHREYAIRGLPFIYSMPDPGFSGVEECIIALPNDDSPIDFNEVVEKYKSLGKGCRERLRAHALQHFSWKTIMARLVAEVLEEGNDSDGGTVAQHGSSAARESISS